MVRPSIDATNSVVASAALFSTLNELKQIKDFLKEQKTLVEAAANSDYGWKAATHMEEGHGFFSFDDQDNMAKLRNAEGYVR